MSSSVIVKVIYKVNDEVRKEENIVEVTNYSSPEEALQHYEEVRHLLIHELN